MYLGTKILGGHYAPFSVFGVETSGKTFSVCELLGCWCVDRVGIGFLMFLAHASAAQAYNLCVGHISPGVPSACSLHRMHFGR